jgi:virginiamycin A acetyltransferase
VIFNFNVLPDTVKKPLTLSISFDEVKNFPALNIDRDSYVVSSEIQTSVNFGNDYVHSVQIGRYCSIATNFTMLIDVTHDYKSVTTARASFLPWGRSIIRRKGQILLQNDVWIGDRVIMMGGVKIGNGAVIGAGSVVSKDIPPYAIAAGNPCRVIRYRFEQDQIDKLQLIRWWDFNAEYLSQHADRFGNVQTFIDTFYPQALEKKQQLSQVDLNLETKKTTFLFCPDFNDSFPVWEKVLRAYCTRFTDRDDVTLLLFPPRDTSVEAPIGLLKSIIESHADSPHVLLFLDDIPDERLLFMRADYFITTRNANTVRWSTYADEFNVRVVSGVDIPVFP